MTTSSLKQVLDNRWLVFVISLGVCLCSGTAYCFGSYSQKIKDTLDWPQHHIELMGELLNVGLYLGPVIGAIVDTYSARTTYALSTVCTLAGYFSVGMLVGRHSDLSPVFYGLLMLVAGFGSGVAFNTTMTVSVRNFKDSPYSARVIGLLSSMFGFSATVFSSLFRGFDLSAASSLQLMAVVLALTFILGMVFVKRTGIAYEPLLGVESPNNVADQAVESSFARVMRCFKTLLIEWSFWVLFVCFTLGAGGGLMMINNVSHIAKSVNGGEEDPDAIVLLVLVLSLFNGAGRILMGLTDYLPLRRGLGFTAALLVMAGAQLYCAVFVTSIASYYVAIAMVGLAYGMLWCILPTLVSELFEVDNFGQNFGTFLLAPAVASLAFNSMAGKFYELQVDVGETDCVGTACYRSAFLAASGAALAGAVLSWSLIRKTSVPHAVSSESTLVE